MNLRLAALALILLSVTACSSKSAPQQEPQPEQPPTVSLAHILQPVRVSPTRDWVALALDGLTLTDRAGHTHRPYDDEDPVQFISWSPTGERLLAVTDGGKVLLTSPDDAVATDLSDKVTSLGKGPDYHAAWSPDGSEVLLSVGSHEAALWRINPSTSKVTRLNDVNKLEAMHWLADGRVLLEVGAGCCGTQKMYLDLATGKVADGGHSASASVSPDGRLIAIGTYLNGELTVIDVATQKTVASGSDFYLAAPRPPVEITGEYRYGALSWSPDSRFLAFMLGPVGSQPMLRVYDFAWLNGQPSRAEQVVQNWAGQHQWIGNDELLYTTQEGGALHVHLGGAKLSSHPGATRLGLLGSAPIAVRSQDRSRLAYAVAYPDETAELVVADLVTGQAETKQRSKDGVAPLLWSPQADRLVAARARFTVENLSVGGQTSYWRLQGLTDLPLPKGLSTSAAARGPFWGAPGTTVTDSQGYPLSTTFAPMTMGGRTFTPVQIDSDTFLLRREGDRVYLDGRLTHAGTLDLWKEPRFLFTLPLTGGTTFELQWEHHNFGIGPLSVEVVGFETVETPAGRFDTLVLHDERGVRSWWAPGVGRVKVGDALAGKIEPGTPRSLPAIAQLDADTTGILSGGIQVIDQTGRVLLEHPINFLRSKVYWVDAGATSPLVLYYTHTMAEPNMTYRAFAYVPTERKFEPVRWRFPDGRTKEQVAGDVQILAEEWALRLRDDEFYPRGAACIFRWNGIELACGAYEEGIATFRYGDEEALIFHLTGPADEEAWSRMFWDPDLGRKAYRDTRSESGRNMFGYRQAASYAEGVYTLSSINRPTFRFTVERRGDQWRVATWEAQ